MNLVPYPRRLLFADGADSLYPDELPEFLYLGKATETGRHVTLKDADRAAHVYICGVTGSGKSRFLENMLVQDITCQRPLCLIDPTGALYRKALDFLGYCVQVSERRGHDLGPLLERYLFLDLDTAGNPLRINPLAPVADESTEEQVDDFLKVAERLFGSIDEMRRIRNTLRGTLWVIAELNRLPEASRPAVSGFAFPLNLRFVAEFLSETDERRALLVNAVPDTDANAYVRTYWTRFFPRYTPSQQQERLESTWNLLQYFLGDTLVQRFFDTAENTFTVSELLRGGKSLFCSLPLGKNLKGSRLIGTFLATKFQRAAYRRPPEQRSPYSLYIDEFHEFADVEFAKAAATLRQYQLRLVNAHQSQSQPPFHTPEGRSILDTIKANAQVKVLFRLSREDAETMTKEMFELTQRRHHFSYEEVSRTRGESETTTRTVSFQRTRSSGMSWSRADSVAIAESETFGVAKTEGTTVGQTLTEGFGESITETLSESITRSASETLTETRSKAHGISVLIGENWSHMVNHNTGFTFTKNESESLAVQRGLSATRTDSTQVGVTDTSGRDYKLTDTSGSSLSRTQNQAAFHDRFGQGRGGSGGSGSSMNEMRSTARSQGESYSQAIQNMRGVANAIGRSASQTGTQQRGQSLGKTKGTTVGQTRGGSRQQGITETDTVSQARAKMQGISHTQGRSVAIGKTHNVSLAESFQQLEQFSRSMSRALTNTVSHTDTISRSQEESLSEGESFATGATRSEGETVTERVVFFSLEGERELNTNTLQKLPQRHCIVAKEALAALEVETYHIPDGYYAYLDGNLPREILQRQLERLAPTLELSAVPEPEPLRDPLAEPPENSPWEF
jgi:hypothetical protein